MKAQYFHVLAAGDSYVRSRSFTFSAVETDGVIRLISVYICQSVSG